MVLAGHGERIPVALSHHGSGSSAQGLAVGQEKLERDVFTFPVFCEAIHARFSGHADEIILDFLRLVGFDASGPCWRCRSSHPRSSF